MRIRGGKKTSVKTRRTNRQLLYTWCVCLCRTGGHAAVVPALPSSTSSHLQHCCSTGEHSHRLQQGAHTGNTNTHTPAIVTWPIKELYGIYHIPFLCSRLHRCRPMGITVPTCRQSLSTTPSLQPPTRPTPPRYIHTHTHTVTHANTQGLSPNPQTAV